MYPPPLACVTPDSGKRRAKGDRDHCAKMRLTREHAVRHWQHCRRVWTGLFCLSASACRSTPEPEASDLNFQGTQRPFCHHTLRKDRSGQRSSQQEGNTFGNSSRRQWWCLQNFSNGRITGNTSKPMTEMTINRSAGAEPPIAPAILPCATRTHLHGSRKNVMAIT
jgi:hypothetical protein